MTVLSDREIRRHLRMGTLLVDPMLAENQQVKGAKIDLRLDNKFRILRSEQAPMWDSQAGGVDNHPPYDRVDVGYRGKFVLHPGNFVIGQTFEVVRMPPTHLGRIEGRSSLARRGVLIHVTASVIDPGFTGNICLELFNLGHVPVVLHPLMRVGALTIEKIAGKVSSAYGPGSQFMGDAIDLGLVSKADKDFDEIRKLVKL